MTAGGPYPMTPEQKFNPPIPPRQPIDDAVQILRQHRAYHAGRIEQYDRGLQLLEELEAMSPAVSEGTPGQGKNMTAHDHREIVPGCYRCEIGLDEVTGAERRDLEMVAGVLTRIMYDPERHESQNPFVDLSPISAYLLIDGRIDVSDDEYDALMRAIERVSEGTPNKDARGLNNDSD